MRNQSTVYLHALHRKSPNIGPNYLRHVNILLDERGFLTLPGDKQIRPFLKAFQSDPNP
jgi:hypothetical protein